MAFTGLHVVVVDVLEGNLASTTTALATRAEPNDTAAKSNQCKEGHRQSNNYGSVGLIFTLPLHVNA